MSKIDCCLNEMSDDASDVATDNIYKHRYIVSLLK